MAICKHAQIIMVNCDGGGVPSRKIRCLAGQDNTCLVNCGTNCTLYETNVRSFQRIIPQGDAAATVQSNQPNQPRRTTALSLDGVRRSVSSEHIMRMQQAADYRARMGSLPRGNCGTCGGGNSAAMR